MSDDALDATNAESALTAADLAALGVALLSPYGKMTIRNEWLIVGNFVLGAGRLKVVPREGLGTTQFKRLIAMAVEVWLHGRRSTSGWKWVSSAGWVTSVGISYPSSSSLLRCASSSSISPASGTMRLPSTL
ncbi:hypothetical protein ACIP5Y_21330 [Nocardia sp. NPDC088792]|uniref:hypothetical protein n=1 Tax=Nocardia sp. NPDC088792 TaxID=3364332 RepID=UPI0037FFDD4A